MSTLAPDVTTDGGPDRDHYPAGLAQPRPSEAAPYYRWTSAVLAARQLTERAVTLVYRAGQRWLHLDVTHLMLLTESDLRQATVPQAPFELGTLSAETVRRFAVDADNALDPRLACRLDSGRNFCVAAADGHTLAGYAWYALDSIEGHLNYGRSPQTGTAISFPAHVAFLYNAFVRDQYRGCGVYRLLNRCALSALRPRGVTAILSTADWSNAAALRSCYGLGFRHLGTIWRWEIAQANFGIYPKLDRRMGIRFGAAAQAGKTGD